LVEVLLLAKLPRESTNCGQVSAACDAGEESSKEEEGRGRRACKENPAKEIGKGEDDQGDPVAKLLTQLGGKENPKKGPKPEDGTNPGSKVLWNREYRRRCVVEPWQRISSPLLFRNRPGEEDCVVAN